MYPTEAIAARVGGRVVVKLLLDASGTPLKACAIAGPRVLRSASERAGLEYRFEPLLLNGKPFQYLVRKVVFEYKAPQVPGP